MKRCRWCGTPTSGSSCKVHWILEKRLREHWEGEW